MRRALPVLLLLLLAACGGGGGTPTTPPVIALTPPPSLGASAVYVANVRAANIVRIDPASGNPLLTLTGGDSPSGVGVTSTGDVAIPTNQRSVLFFHPGAATPYNIFSDSQLCDTYGISFDSSDNAYVFDSICSTVYEYARGSQGAVSAISSLFIDKKLHGGVASFDVDGTGVFYALESDSTHPPSVGVYKQTASGWTEEARIDGSSDFPNAETMAADAQGDVYVVNNDTDLLKYKTNGSFVYTLTKTTVSNLCAPSALRAATLSDGTQDVNYIYAASPCAGGGAGSLSVYGVDATPTPDPVFQITGPNTQLALDYASGIAVDQSASSASGTVYESNPNADTVNGYCFGCWDDSFPTSQFSLGYPGMAGIQAIWFASGLMYTTDAATPAISLYNAPSKSATGSQFPAPIARVIGKDTGLCGPAYAITDAHNNLYVANACNTAAGTGNYIAKFALPAGIHGDTNLPSTVFAGAPHTCPGGLMCNPQQMAFDAQGNLYVTNYGDNGTDGHPYSAGSIEKFSPAGTLTGVLTSADIHNPSGIALDTQGNIGVLSNVGPSPGPANPEIAFFAPSAVSAPSAPISATPVRKMTGIVGGTPFPQMVIDKDGTIYVDEFTEIVVYAPNASGNAIPSHVFHEPNVLSGGTGIALQP